MPTTYSTDTGAIGGGGGRSSTLGESDLNCRNHMGLRSGFSTLSSPAHPPCTALHSTWKTGKKNAVTIAYTSRRKLELM